MPIQRLNPTIINPPLSKLYKRYDEITESHCKNLLIYLYTHYITEWINPITKKEVQRDSPIIISFLSKCYWGEWGEKEVTINGINKRYKIHVSYFIDEWYLYDVRFRQVPKRKSPPIPNLTPVINKPLIKSPKSPPPGASSRSNSPAGAPLPRSKSPPKIAINVPVRQGRPGSQAPGAATNRPRVQSPPGAATNRPRVQSPPGAATNRPRVQSPQSPPGAATNRPRVQSPQSPPGAATNRPRVQLPQSPPGAAINKLSSPKIDFSPRSSYAASNKSATLSINADKLNEDKCSNLVKEIRDIIKGKTKEEIKLLKVPNPITKQMIGLKSPILLSYLTKCYFAYDKNEELQKSIKKIVNIKGLEIYNDIRMDMANAQEKERLAREQEEEEKRLALEETKKKMKEKIPIIDKYIEGLVDEFNVRCDELINNCDKDGVLNSHRYISNVINSIIIIIYTKYLHLPYYYNELYMNNSSQLDLKVFMYDETFREYYESKSLVPWEEFKKYFYDNKNIIYQKHDLTKEVTHTNINLEPKTIENYYLNTLINRQHVFEAFKYDPNGNGGRNYNTHFIQYNKLNTSHNLRKDFNNYKFPDSLKFAKEIIDELNINYNITNGLLPKTIFWWSLDNTIATNKPFSIDIINDKLRTLPTITGIANEATIKNDHYEAIINVMKGNLYGNNETEYGGDDMIRKNILYSLNAQTPTYIQQNMNQHKQDIYYNYEYTGTYPLFSWIPLNHQNIDSHTNENYCYPMSTKWQPLEIDLAFLKLIELDYKNHGVAPYSTYLNETIYKVITDEYASVKSLIHANRIQAMRKRIINTIGVYKDKTRKSNYKNKKIYLYHGTKNRLHSIGGKEKEIEILGFLSTSLSVYIASYYSGLAINNVGLIYIIEVDDTQSYINLNDLLNQILILPLSRIKIIMEFNVGAIRIILCRLFRTPLPTHNNLLYNKLLDQNMIYANTYVTYRITTNNNIMPTCAYILGDLWKINKDMPYKENLEIYKVMRRNLNNIRINDKKTMTTREREDEFLYFSLGQEYELYVDRGLPLISGSLEDIKYSIHQHFIKDCYKALDIPCIDYIFIHGANKAKNTITGTQFNKCPISTGILLKDYINNRTNVYKYNINNFLIDSIFKFNSIKHDNKKLNLQEMLGDNNQYADKIEGFRDAGAYLNGSINPLFKKDEEVGEHIQYMRDWNHLFIKYKEASNEDLAKHFDWCHKRITKLMEIITSVSENYLFFISKTLKGNTKTSQALGRESVLSPNSKEYNELFNLIKNLEETLLKRAKFYLKCTHDGGRGGGKFIDFIKFLLSNDTQQNTHNSKLYTDAIQEDLILDDTDLFLGGIKSIKEMTKQGMIFKPDIDKAMETNSIHMKIYEEFKNIPISESKDMRKFEDMPEDIREYYNLTDKDEGKYIDISNNCHFRFINKKDDKIINSKMKDRRHRSANF